MPAFIRVWLRAVGRSQHGPYLSRCRASSRADGFPVSVRALAVRHSRSFEGSAPDHPRAVPPRLNFLDFQRRSPADRCRARWTRYKRPTRSAPPASAHASLAPRDPSFRCENRTVEKVAAGIAIEELCVTKPRLSASTQRWIARANSSKRDAGASDFVQELVLPSSRVPKIRTNEFF